jgi:hypothetical protein
MMEKLKYNPSVKTKVALNAIFLSIIAIFFYLNPSPLQGQDYWANAPSTGLKVFSISFINDQDGNAVSAEGDVLVTTDCGKSWSVNNNVPDALNEPGKPNLWTAEIFCSIMQTTDGGKTWIPYTKEKQEHFCGVYLKDLNSGYKVAAEFLNKVTTVIMSSYNENKIGQLLNHPIQCTEYYRSPEEGWAVGWCVKYFDSYSVAKVKYK